MNTVISQRIKFNQGLVPKSAQIIVENFKSTVDTTELNSTDLGKATIAKLIEGGVTSVEQLKTLKEEDLKEILKNPLSIKSALKFINK